MKPRHQRLVSAALALAAVGVAAALVLSAFSDNIVFFFSPTQVVNGEAPVARRMRIGGLVQEGSVRRGPDGMTTTFVVSDTVNTIRVTYRGLLPDLFKEGRGCVAQGTVGPDGSFTADLVLAKHDENYMPIEAAQSIDDARRAAARAAASVVE